MIDQNSNPKPYCPKFLEVLDYELQRVNERRNAVVPAEPPSTCKAKSSDLEAVRAEAHKLNLFGVAFSGGGIRSGTVCLGILQALASLKLLRRVDYLSTVSGGGFIGGWLAAWIRRESESLRILPPASTTATPTDAEIGREAVENVEFQLDPNRLQQAQAAREDRTDCGRRHRVKNKVYDAEPEPIRHLRSYSRYLTPQSGVFSLDSWAVVAVYLRNTMMNLLSVLPVLLACLLLIRLAVAPLQESGLTHCNRMAMFVLGSLCVLFGTLAWQLRRRWREGCHGRCVVLFYVCASLVCLGAAFWCYSITHHASGPDPARQVWGWFLLFLLPLLTAYLCLGYFLAGVRLDPKSETDREKLEDRSQMPRSGSGWAIRLTILVLVTTSALVAHYVFGRDGPECEHSRITPLLETVYSRTPQVDNATTGLTTPPNSYESLGTWGRAALIYGALGLFGGGVLFLWRLLVLRNGWWRSLNLFAATVAYGFVLGLLVWLGIHLLNFREDMVYDPVAVLCFGPPLYMFAVVLAGYTEIAIAGQFFAEPEREWRSRMAGMLLMSAAGWAAVGATVFYLPDLILNGGAYSAIVWAVGVVGTYFAKYAPTSNDSPGLQGRAMRLLSLVAPVIILVGLLGMMSLGVGYVLNNFEWPPEPPAAPAYAKGMSSPPPSQLPFLRALEQQSISGLGHSGRGITFNLGLAALALGAAGFTLLFIVRVNTFSLHALFANRLIRCYLGASRNSYRWYYREDQEERNQNGTCGAPTGVLPPTRGANEFTDFDARDDLPLARLRCPADQVPTVDRRLDGQEQRQGYYGPYPLFVTTLNLVEGAALAEQDRKGESFVLSPDFCGSQRTGYARMEQKFKDFSIWENLTVGHAVAISGAAIDPNMKNYQSAPFTMLLTLLNLRVGSWIENPNHATSADPWTAKSPRNGFLLWDELMGRTHANGPQVHLSDGGHFENSGAYELIRRRCRYVVAVDAAEDPQDASENLANLIRLVRIDFGIRIEIDTSPLKKDDKRLSRSHVAVGTIRYDDVDFGGINGTFVFIRSSLTGDEPADIKNYAAANPAFPHHPTLDQFFDEDQFESYRMLGVHIGQAVFGMAAEEVKNLEESSGKLSARKFNQELFSTLRRQWTQVSTSQYEKYAKSVDSSLSWENTLSSNGKLNDLNRNIYPELDAATNIGDAAAIAELTAILNSLTPTVSPAVRAAVEKALNRVTSKEEIRYAEFWALSQLFEVMETTWIELDLDNTFSHPLNRGWMNCFRQWTASSLFQKYWPIFHGQYSWGFTRFCQRILNVVHVPVLAVPLAKVPEGPVKQLDTEFHREWGNYLHEEWPAWENNYLERVTNEAKAISLGWVLTYGQSGGAKNINADWDPAGSNDHFPSYAIGVAAVRKWEYGRTIDMKDAKLTDAEKACGSTATGDEKATWYELFFWIRGGYRTSEIGKEILPELLEEITTTLKPKTKESKVFLMTRFPRAGETAADSLQRAQWATFFNDHDFTSYRLNPLVAEWEIRLRREIVCG